MTSHVALEQTVIGMHRMLTALIGVMAEEISLEQVVKTLRNDVRIGTILKQIQDTEVQIIAEEAKLKEVKGETAAPPATGPKIETAN